MTDVIETNGKYRVRLEIMQDSAGFNPRMDRDINLANVITPKGQRFIDVDKDGGPLQDGWDRLAEKYDDSEAIKIFTIWARVFHGVKVVEDRPYDGVRSLWYVTPEKLAETPWPAERIIGAEAKEYREWARGEVYGWVVEKDVTRVPKDSEDIDDEDIDDETRSWEHKDSCWGCIGREYAESAAREAFAPYTKEDGK